MKHAKLAPHVRSQHAHLKCGSEPICVLSRMVWMDLSIWRLLYKWSIRLKNKAMLMLMIMCCIRFFDIYEFFNLFLLYCSILIIHHIIKNSNDKSCLHMKTQNEECQLWMCFPRFRCSLSGLSGPALVPKQVPLITHQRNVHTWGVILLREQHYLWWRESKPFWPASLIEGVNKPRFSL